MAGRPRDASCFEEPGLIEDQWDPERRFVSEDAVGPLPVFTEGLAVVGRQDHEGPTPVAGGQQRLQQWGERGVGRGHLTVVGVAPEARGERFGRRVGVVRLEDVHPAEERLALLRVEPPAGERHRIGPGALLRR